MEELANQAVCLQNLSAHLTDMNGKILKSTRGEAGTGTIGTWKDEAPQYVSFAKISYFQEYTYQQNFQIFMTVNNIKNLVADFSLI